MTSYRKRRGNNREVPLGEESYWVRSAPEIRSGHKGQYEYYDDICCGQKPP